MNWNLGHLFASVADAMADREAMVVGATRLSYGELDERANRLAQVLHRAGVGPGDTVGLVLRNGHEYLEAMLGAFKLGAVPVNVNTRYTADELHYLLDDAGVVLVLHEPELDDRLAEATAGWHAVRGHLAGGPAWEAALATADPTPPPIVDRRGDDRYILYTGGTTGRPKGVIWRHEDLFFAALGGGNPGGVPVTCPAEVVDHARRGRLRCLPASPFAHGTAHWMAFATLLHGGTVVVSDDADPAPDDAVGPRAGRAGDDARDRRRRVRPPVGDALAAEPDRWDLGRLLVVVLSGGATLSPAVRQQLLRHLPGTVLVDGYGTSETGGQGSMPVWPGQADGGLPRFQSTATPRCSTMPVDRPCRAAGSSAGWPVGAACPLGYLGDPSGQRGHVPGDRRRALGGPGRPGPDRGRWLGHVARSGRELDQLGRREGLPRGGRGGAQGPPGGARRQWWSACPTTRWGEQVTAVVQLRPGRPVLAADLIVHCRAQLADFKAPRRSSWSIDLQRKPTGKPDFRLGAGGVRDDSRRAGHQAVGARS